MTINQAKQLIESELEFQCKELGYSKEEAFEILASNYSFDYYSGFISKMDLELILLLLGFDSNVEDIKANNKHNDIKGGLYRL